MEVAEAERKEPLAMEEARRKVAVWRRKGGGGALVVLEL